MTTHDTPEAVYASRHGDDCECGCHEAEARAYESGQNFALLHARLVHGCDHGQEAPMTTRDTPEAAIAAALDHSCVAHRFDSWEHWKQDHAAAILAAMPDWTLRPNDEGCATSRRLGVPCECNEDAGAESGWGGAVLDAIPTKPKP
jgi:hypothetical protein